MGDSSPQKENSKTELANISPSLIIDDYQEPPPLFPAILPLPSTGDSDGNGGDGDKKVNSSRILNSGNFQNETNKQSQYDEWEDQLNKEMEELGSHYPKGQKNLKLDDREDDDEWIFVGKGVEELESVTKEEVTPNQQGLSGYKILGCTLSDYAVGIVSGSYKVLKMINAASSFAAFVVRNRGYLYLMVPAGYAFIPGGGELALATLGFAANSEIFIVMKGIEYTVYYGTKVIGYIIPKDK